MENKKPIVGIDLGIDPEYLEQVVRQTVSVGIAEALGGKEAVASEIIHSVLNARVNSDGKIIRPHDYGYRDAKTVIDYYTQRVIKNQVQEVLKEIVEEKRADIKKAIKKELSKPSTIDGLTGEFVHHLLSVSTDYWRPKINISFEQRN